MSRERLQKMLAKSEVTKFKEYDVELTVKGLNVMELADLVQLIEKKDAKGAVKMAVRKTFAINFPDMGEEEFESVYPTLSGGLCIEIFKKVQELSGLKAVAGEEKN